MSERIVNVQPWATSNTRVAYPFYPDVDTTLVLEDDLRALFVDAVILHDEENTAVRDLELGYLNYDGSGDWPSNPFDVAVTWSDNEPFFDSGTPPAGLITKTVEWGEWIIVEWSHYVADPIFSIKFVLRKDLLDNLTYPMVPFPRYAFVQRVLEARRSHLRTITPENPPFVPIDILAGPLIFMAGYNVNIGVSQENSQGLRRQYSLEFDALAGAGIGAFVRDCDEAVEELKTINGIGPDDRGNWTFEAGGGCYWFTRGVTPQEEMIPAYILFSNSCGVCCACEDYVTSYEVLSRAVDSLRITAGRIPGVKVNYLAVYNDYKTQKEAVEGIHTRLRLFSKHGWTVGVQILTANSTTCILNDISIQVDHNTSFGYEVVEGSAWLYTPGAKKEQVTIDNSGLFSTTKDIVPGSAVVLEYELYFKKDEGRLEGALINCDAQVILGGVAGSFVSTAAFSAPLRKSMEK